LSHKGDGGVSHPYPYDSVEIMDGFRPVSLSKPILLLLFFFFFFFFFGRTFS
jgi:hypothetical protein